MDCLRRNSPVKTLKSTPFVMTASGGIFPKATSLSMTLFAIEFIKSFITNIKRPCQTDEVRTGNAIGV
jgi:hypothetical protein